MKKNIKLPVMPFKSHYQILVGDALKALSKIEEEI